MNILEIKNFSKTYKGNKKAVDNLSITVEAGDIYGFIGHNGAGKSTTIKSVVGVLEFTEGEIYIDGYFVRSKSEVIIANMLVQEEVPFVYEEPLFAPDGTMFLPDFTVKFRGETYYWEHVGRLDLPDYRAHWEIKEKWYEKHFPGKLLTHLKEKIYLQMLWEL